MLWIFPLCLCRHQWRFCWSNKEQLASSRKTKLALSNPVITNTVRRREVVCWVCFHKWEHQRPNASCVCSSSPAPPVSSQSPFSPSPHSSSLLLILLFLLLLFILIFVCHCYFKLWKPRLEKRCWQGGTSVNVIQSRAALFLLSSDCEDVNHHNRWSSE